MSFLLRFQRASRLSLIIKSNKQSILKNNWSYRRLSATKPKVEKTKKKSKSNSDGNIETSNASATSIDTAALSATNNTQSLESDGSVDALAAATAASTKSDQWRMRWYKFRRLLMWFGIPFGISTSLFMLHDSDIPYVYCFKKLQKYPLPDDFDPSKYQFGSADNPPPNPAPVWAQTLPFLWAQWAHSQRPGRIMKQWNHFMPLLDKKYPAETRMVAIGCLLAMLSGGPDTMPPFVFYDKCMRKLEILRGYKSDEVDGNWTPQRFLNTIYALCGEVGNTQMMFTGLQLLMDLASIPNAARKEDIEYVWKNVQSVPNMREDLVESLLEIYQDPVYVIEFCKQNPPKKKQKVFKPKFIEVKKILIKNGAMKFAFKLLDAKSPQLQQMAMFLLIALVGKYPDINELKQELGDTDDEKIQNGIKLVDSLARMGQEHFVRGENEAALGAFQEALKFFQTSAQLRYFTGKCLSELGRVEEAKEQYKMSMLLTPKERGSMPEATLQLCNLLIKHASSTDDLEDAVEYLESLIDSGTYIYYTVEPIDVSDIYDRLILVLEKLNRYDDALDRLLNLCKIKPNGHQVHFDCGRMALLCKDYDLAKEHLEFSCKLEPFDMYTKYHLALALFHLDEYQQCKHQLLHILETKPNDEKCLNLLARIHINDNHWDYALEIYKRLNTEKYKDKNAYLKYQMGVAYENMNNSETANECFMDCANMWLNKTNTIGYNQYFYNRPKEMKAYQKIATRCEANRNDDKWNALDDIMFKIGMN